MFCNVLMCLSRIISLECLGAVLCQVLSCSVLMWFLIMFLTWAVGMVPSVAMPSIAPFLASLSAFSLPQCPACPRIHAIFTLLLSASSLRALWHLSIVMDLLNVVDKAWIVAWLSV